MKMNARDGVILFITLWSIISALASPSVEIFITIELIGTLVTLEVGDLYLPRDTKETLKNISYLLLLVFVFIVARKIYNVVK